MSDLSDIEQGIDTLETTGMSTTNGDGGAPTLVGPVVSMNWAPAILHNTSSGSLNNSSTVDSWRAAHDNDDDNYSFPRAPSPTPPTQIHRERVRQTTDATMIMSNTAQHVNDFFFTPHVAEGCNGQDKDADCKGNEVKRQASQAISDTISSPQPAQPQTWGRGILEDFRGTAGKYWKQEMTNFQPKTVGVSLFLFFACVAPAITFGAMYGKMTHYRVGTVEMLIVDQLNIAPLHSSYLISIVEQMINGGTGPVLAFAGVLYKLSESMSVPFLTFNAWCGLWVCFYMMLAAATDANRVIRFATRFTDEIFALLIAAIFVVEALGSPVHPVGVFYYFDPSHESHQKHQGDPDYSYMETALLSLLVMLGTMFLAYFLRDIKYTTYLWHPSARNVCSDFAITLSILTFTLIAHLGFPSVPLEELKVPDTLAPTLVCCTASCHHSWPDECPDIADPYGRRPWLVDLFDLNGKTYVPFVAAGPAILAFILIFLDDGITKHLMNHPCHKLQHGTAYNYDTVIIGGMIAVNSILGLPWLVAATVRSLNHLHALADKSADGKTIYSVMETRLTGLFAHILILCASMALGAIRLIPIPVLYGVFLYMGLTTLPTNQLFNRCLLFLMQPSQYADANVEPFIENVKTWRIHLFTGIQLVLFGLLYGIKSVKPIAVAFPIVIASCIPIRLYLLPKIFTEDELVLMDSGDDALVDRWLDDHGRTRQTKLVPLKPYKDDEMHHNSICGGDERNSLSLKSRET
ncbi:Electroneutral sodium bicarbonate exchanger 1 [Seminavis robusta]|uniref:Electroneutral sodium bicarbonate exchanger 1 n=1 Tax=Seminavis robusta TaxID=568900 RepID=A0A9N8ENC2_9STRA|nr:Electroneutral sodium bicarbonate exchanger 1 [Seminavis robusta]|eukprot:Sro1614_g286110.1 Electroneutral sodium bicarbonate exchanger 1 (747) ;mRNA; r:10704-13415